MEATKLCLNAMKNAFDKYIEKSFFKILSIIKSFVSML